MLRKRLSFMYSMRCIMSGGLGPRTVATARPAGANAGDARLEVRAELESHDKGVGDRPGGPWVDDVLHVGLHP
jgi:hypothetical protein